MTFGRSFYNFLSVALLGLIGQFIVWHPLRNTQNNLHNVVIHNFEDARAFGVVYPLSLLTESETLDITGITPKIRQRLWDDRLQLVSNPKDPNDGDQRLKTIGGIAKKSAEKIQSQLQLR